MNNEVQDPVATLENLASRMHQLRARLWRLRNTRVRQKVKAQRPQSGPAFHVAAQPTTNASAISKPIEVPEEKPQQKEEKMVEEQKPVQKQAEEQKPVKKQAVKKEQKKKFVDESSNKEFDEFIDKLFVEDDKGKEKEKVKEQEKAKEQEKPSVAITTPTPLVPTEQKLSKNAKRRRRRSSSATTGTVVEQPEYLKVHHHESLGLKFENLNDHKEELLGIEKDWKHQYDQAVAAQIKEAHTKGEHMWQDSKTPQEPYPGEKIFIPKAPPMPNFDASWREKFGKGKSQKLMPVAAQKEADEIMTVDIIGRVFGDTPSVGSLVGPKKGGKPSYKSATKDVSPTKERRRSEPDISLNQVRYEGNLLPKHGVSAVERIMMKRNKLKDLPQTEELWKNEKIHGEIKQPVAPIV